MHERMAGRLCAAAVRNKASAHPRHGRCTRDRFYLAQGRDMAGLGQAGSGS